MGKDSHEKKKSSETIKENAKGRGESLEKKKKKGKMLAFFLFLTPFLFSTSATGQENWQGLSVPWPGKEKILEYLIQKEVVREQYVLEKSGKEQDDDTANQVLKEGAAVYLKEGKVLFFKIREEKNRLIRTEGIYSLGILMSLLLVFTENVYYNFY